MSNCENCPLARGIDMPRVYKESLEEPYIEATLSNSGDVLYAGADANEVTNACLDYNYLKYSYPDFVERIDSCEGPKVDNVQVAQKGLLGLLGINKTIEVKHCRATNKEELKSIAIAEIQSGLSRRTRIKKHDE